MSNARRTGVGGSLTLLLFLVAVRSVEAQRIIGDVVDRSTGQPVAGAFVVLLNSADERVAGALTDHTGRFILLAPSAATYRLRAERIGLATELSAPIELGPELTRYRFELESSAISLAEVVVAADTRQCAVRPQDGTQLQLIWDQVRTALETATWTEQTGHLRSELMTYERLIDPVTRRVGEETFRGRRMLQRVGFVAADATDLVTHGFVRADDEGDDVGFTFYGLDAATIVSNAFLDRHCFRVQRATRSRQGLVGLAFEPVRGGDVPGVRGVLWLDESTAELRTLEYTYTWLPWTLPLDMFGGETMFRRVPGGAWIVERWSIRMPHLDRPPPDLARRQVRRRPVNAVAYLRDEAGLQIKEEGGEVTALYTASGIRLPGPERAVLAGTVHDSVAGNPLADARVWLEGTDREALTDARGRYRMDDLNDGVYSVRFTHTALAQLGVESLARDVELVRGDIAVGDLGVPSLATLLSETCPATAEHAGRPVVGRVIDERTGRGVRGATVSLQLSDVGTERAIEASTGPGGVYRFCDVPDRGRALITAGFLGSDVAEQSVQLSATEPVFHELTVRLDAPSRVVGQVVDAVTGQPISGAVISLAGEQDAVTGAQGRFVFARVRPGDHLLQTAHLGYAALEDTVRIDGTGRTFNVTVRVGAGAIALDPILVDVNARPMTGALASVYDRIDRVRLYGGGSVFDREDILRRNPGRFTHLLGEIGSVRIESRSLADRTIPVIVSTRSNSGFDLCPMTIYMDGIMLFRGGASGDAGTEDINLYLAVSNIEAVEVYHPGQRIPPEYWGSAAGCGVILVWSRRGGGR